MPGIVHRLTVYAPPERVFDLLASAEGIASVTWACARELIELQQSTEPSEGAYRDVDRERVIH